MKNFRKEDVPAKGKHSREFAREVESPPKLNVDIKKLNGNAPMPNETCNPSKPKPENPFNKPKNDLFKHKNMCSSVCFLNRITSKAILIKILQHKNTVCCSSQFRY
jgi:hypothetical protein